MRNARCTTLGTDGQARLTVSHKRIAAVAAELGVHATATAAEFYLPPQRPYPGREMACRRSGRGDTESVRSDRMPW